MNVMNSWHEFSTKSAEMEQRLMRSPSLGDEKTADFSLASLCMIALDALKTFPTSPSSLSTPESSENYKSGRIAV